MIAASQSSAADTSFISTAVSRARKHNVQLFAINSPLYNGVRYKDYQLYPEDVGQPYWSDGKWRKGSVDYDGYRFDNVEMNYNLITDKVIIINPYSELKQQLISEKIKYFILNNHFFRKIDHSPSSMPTGFYEVVAEGKVTLYKKDVKNRQPITKSRVVLSDYRQKITYYVYKDGGFSIVRSKGSIVKILGVRKTAVRTAMNKNSGSDREAFMKAAVLYYNAMADR